MAARPGVGAERLDQAGPQQPRDAAAAVARRTARYVTKPAFTPPRYTPVMVPAGSGSSS
jgi:hypothetical protein